MRFFVLLLCVLHAFSAQAYYPPFVPHHRSHRHSHIKHASKYGSRESSEERIRQYRWARVEDENRLARARDQQWRREMVGLENVSLGHGRVSSSPFLLGVYSRFDPFACAHCLSVNLQIAVLPCFMQEAAYGRGLQREAKACSRLFED